MKIALLTTWFPPIIVGSGNRFYEVGKRLSKEHEVHVYTVGIEGAVCEEIMDGMHIHRYGKFSTSKSIERESFLINLKFSLFILKQLYNKRFDIIDCNIVSKTLPYASYIISKNIHVPMIETWHEVWYKDNFKQYHPVLGLFGFFMELFFPKLSDFNIAVSPTTKKRLVELLNVDQRKIAVISNGVDLYRFNNITTDKKQGRILYVGRLESHKCVDKLLLAYHQLKKSFNNTELIIIGDGPQKEYLQSLSEQLNLQHVRFCHGLPYEQLIAIMKSSRILVLPSIMEGQGIVLLEAMAAGTPPIAVRAEGSAVCDVIQDNYNGLLVTHNTMEKAIFKLMTNNNFYTTIRNNGLRFVEQYDWDEIAKQTYEIYEQIWRR